MISTQPFVAGSVFMSIIITLCSASLLWGINRLQQCRDRTPTEALLVALDVLLGLEQAQAGDVGKLRLDGSSGAAALDTIPLVRA